MFITMRFSNHYAHLLPMDFKFNINLTTFKINKEMYNRKLAQNYYVALDGTSHLHAHIS